MFQPFIVTLSDVFGRRLLYLISLGFFTLGTVVCCASQNFTQLLAGRSVQGIGGGGILALGLVVLTDIIPLRQRPVFIGINQISWALGSISGPLLGGIFAQYTTWRWIFYINFPFCAIGFVTVPLVMRLHAERPPIKERLQAIDWLGSGLFIASTTIFLIGLTWGGSQYSWSSWQTLVPIIVGLAGFLTMIAWERYWASNPFLRLELFNSYSAIVAYSCAVLQGLSVGHPYLSWPDHSFEIADKNLTSYFAIYIIFHSSSRLSRTSARPSPAWRWCQLLGLSCLRASS